MEVVLLYVMIGSIHSWQYGDL